MRTVPRPCRCRPPIGRCPTASFTSRRGRCIRSSRRSCRPSEADPRRALTQASACSARGMPRRRRPGPLTNARSGRFVGWMTVTRGDQLAVVELGKRSMAGTFGHVLMLLTAQLLAPNAHALPLALVWGWFGVMLVARVAGYHFAIHHPERSVSLWLAALGSIGCNLVWGMVTAGVAHKVGYGLPMVTYFAFLCGIASASVNALAPKAWLQRSAFVLLLVPTMIFGLVDGMPAFTLLFGIFLVFSWFLGTAATRDFWTTARANAQLRVYAADQERAALAAAAMNVQLRDETAQRLQMEVELRQAQKLEAIGRLAAGIAHEINTPVQFVTDSCTIISEATSDVDAILAEYRDARRSGSRQDHRRASAGARHQDRASDQRIRSAARPRQGAREPQLRDRDDARDLPSRNGRGRRCRDRARLAPSGHVPRRRAQSGVPQHHRQCGLCNRRCRASPSAARQDPDQDVGDARSGQGRDQRHRRRHQPRGPRQDLRSVLHDQTGRQGKRPGSVDRAVDHRRQARRHTRCRIGRRRRYDVHDRPSRVTASSAAGSCEHCGSAPACSYARRAVTLEFAR